MSHPATLRPSLRPTASEPPRPLVWLAAIALVAIAALEIMTLGPIHPSGIINDFTNFYYPAGKQVLAGHLLYAAPTPSDFGFLYPPFAAILVAPFALLPVALASIAWYAAEIAVLGACAVAASHRFAGPRLRPLAAAGTFVGFTSFVPIDECLMKGQIDIWLMAPLLVAFLLASRTSGLTRRGALGVGMLLGLVAAVKLYPLLTLVLLVYMRRSRARLVLLGGAVALVVSLLVPLLLGDHVFVSYVQATLQLGRLNVTGWPFFFGALAIMDRGFTVTRYATPLITLPTTLVSAAVDLASLAFVIVAARRSRRMKIGNAWSAALLITVAVIPILEIEHLVMLALVPILLANDLPRAERPLLLLLVVATGVNALTWPALGGHYGQVLSLLDALGVAAWALRMGLNLGWAGMCFGYVLTSAPGFLEFAAQWGVPMSFVHVVLGSAEYVALLLFAVPVALIGLQVKKPCSESGTVTRASAMKVA